MLANILCLLSLTIALPAKDAPAVETAANARSGRNSDALCGIYCLHAITRLYGQQADIRDWVKPAYVSTPKGSSLANLRDAARDHGLYTLMLGRLETDDLRTSPPWPLILHVNREVGGEYAHFIVYLGVEDGKARIWDPPKAITLLPLEQLAPRWDGMALAVSDSPIRPGSFLWSSWLRRGVMAAAGCALVLSLRRLDKSRLRAGTSLNLRERLLSSGGGCVGIVIVALVTAVAHHGLSQNGLLACSEATEGLQQSLAAKFIPKITLGQMRRLLDHKVTIVDARRRRDYEAGHVTSAINIPVGTSATERKALTQSIPRNKRIVVYCQSSGCPYAGSVAVNLKTDGFSKVSIFRGGWVEWAKGQKP